MDVTVYVEHHFNTTSANQSDAQKAARRREAVRVQLDALSQRTMPDVRNESQSVAAKNVGESC
ncbi:hypothetical protein RSO41_06705 [Halomonas sp. I1]|uniref:hypothetical protein n=1 Tax=Halomonas sp. I1 TaxID=393536 RepID=UPI0028E09DC6|nr:hypothetical protein [Halomonas sp. I1]MDT8894343.1 hypothetical protein [Halomonas sp. I1]